MNSHHFLSNRKPKLDSDISRLIKKVNKIIKEFKISRILDYHSYERVVPINLWFHYINYRVSNYQQNDQNIRIRYLNNIMLTPLSTTDPSSMIQSFVPNMSLYQPFYPESFYSIWEILQMGYIQFANSVLHIGKEDRSGTLESIMLYYEKYQLTDQKNIFHLWLSGQEQYDPMDNKYYFQLFPIDYLNQAYQVTYLKSSSELQKYDLISIDTIQLFDHLFDWKTEEMDLEANIFYFITALHHLNINGSLIIRLNLICSKSWSIIFEIAQTFFKEYTFVRPDVLNPFNTEIYLIMNKFVPKVILGRPYYQILKNLYRFQSYQTYYLNIDPDINQVLYKKFIKARNKWAEKLEISLLKITDKKINHQNQIDQWHKSNNLLQIKDLSKQITLDPIKIPINCSKGILEIMPSILSEKFGDKINKLLQKKAELNHCKRVMDTKPNQVFTTKNFKLDYLITWENINNKTSCIYHLKTMIKKSGAEMVTNAWIKMYEMLHLQPHLLPNATNQTCITSFHLCEAPGAFISALHHYLSKNKQKLNWFGQSLKPNQNTEVLEDHFGLISAYPDRWLFGDEKGDNSGDISHSAVIRYYASHSRLSYIDFMTADAGIRCQPNQLNDQEMLLTKINMGQIICILACLSIGKSAIFKTFLPLTEPLNISMMAIVTKLFHSVEFIKPVSSQSANSEIYVSLHNYRGISQSSLNILYEILDDALITSKQFLFSEFDQSFMDAYLNGTSQLIDKQIQALHRNYYYYYHPDELVTLKEEHQRIINDWLKNNPISPLDNYLLNK